jgi:uncharacterized membrane protein
MHVVQAVSLVAATLTAGLVAGLMAAFSYAVMPGLARAGDRVFVETMQRINIAIVNAWFMIIFLGTLIFGVVAAVTHMRAGTWPVAWWALAGLAFYVIGLVITGTVNVPLNKQLDAAGSTDDLVETAVARNRFEARWVRWNLIRAVACLFAFACFAWALVLHGQHL